MSCLAYVFCECVPGLELEQLHNIVKPLCACWPSFFLSFVLSLFVFVCCMWMSETEPTAPTSFACLLQHKSSAPACLNSTASLGSTFPAGNFCASSVLACWWTRFWADTDLQPVAQVGRDCKKKKTTEKYRSACKSPCTFIKSLKPKYLQHKTIKNSMSSPFCPLVSNSIEVPNLKHLNKSIW